MNKLQTTVTRLKESSKDWFTGELTLTKRECWLIGAVLVLSGILVGILLSPAKNGFSWSLCSNNGNNNGNNSGNNAEQRHTDTDCTSHSKDKADKGKDK